MQRLKAIETATATGRVKDLFNGVQAKLGSVPGMFRTMGNSAAVLEGYLNFNGALAGGLLGGRVGELIALTVANANGCEYCNAAHSLIGEKMLRIDGEAIAGAREGRSGDPKIQAALDFARVVVQKKGHISDADFAAVKEAGYSDAAIAEIIAHVALNILTNYFNTAARVLVDFPRVELVETAVI